MSTKLWLFKVQKTHKFKFVDTLRKYAIQSRANWQFADEKHKIKVADFVQDNRDEFISEAQFFEFAHSDFEKVYLVRILESGYLLRNWLTERRVPAIFRDGRAQSITPRYERIATEVDSLIRKRHYFVVPIVSVEDLLSRIWKAPIVGKEVSGDVEKEA